MTQLVGVEVEFIGPVETVITRISDAGLSSRLGRASYVGHDSHNWLVKNDTSVYRQGSETAGPLGDFAGGEMVSPPLDFHDPVAREQITKAVQVLQDAGCYPNQTTGIHVHVDVSDLSVKQLVAIVKNFYKFEDVLYRLASSGHAAMRTGTRQFAPKLQAEQVRRITRARTMAELKAAWYDSTYDYSTSHSHSSRYCGINLHSYFYRGTIEFRLFNGSVNPMRVQTYVAICVAMVEDARRGKSRSVNKRYALGDMATGVAPEANALHRFQQVVRYDGGMGLEDMKNITKIWKDSVPQSSTAA